MFAAACGHTNDHADHDHDHDHNHEEVHDHDHEGHDHESESVQSTEHPGEISFSKVQAEAAGLQIQQIAAKPFAAVIKVGGQIQAAQGDEITLVATAGGVVSFVKTMVEGAAIKQGETLLTISAKNLAEGDPVLKTKLAYETAEREYRRAQSLLKDTLVSQREYEQARLNFETAKVAYDALAASQTSKGVSVASSIDGWVKNKLVNEGDYVAMGQPIVTISRNKRLQLKAEVPEQYYQNLSSIRSANFLTPYDRKLYQIAELNGRLISYGKSSGDSFYIPVNFEFDNIGTMIPGAFVEVYLLAEATENAIAVPLTALIEEQGIYSVFIRLEEGIYMKQQVKIGTDNGQDVQILSGLKVGDQVVVKGAMQIKLASNASVIPEGHSHSH